MIYINDYTVYDNSLFTYFIRKYNKNMSFTLSRHIFINEYLFEFSKQTDFIYYVYGNRAICIIGLCVDSLGGSVPEIIKDFVEKYHSFYDFLNLESRLAGKYAAVFFADKNDFIITGDATCSLQVNYLTDAGTAISSSANLIAQYYKLGYWDTALAIRAKSDISQAMPNDITLYKNIKQLLPNHCFSVSERTAARFEYIADRSPLGIEDCAAATVGPVINIIKSYMHKYDIVCPLTGGYDSRVVLAFLMTQLPHIPCYTLKHKHKADDPELSIPKDLTAMLSLPYLQYDDITAPDTLINTFDLCLGRNMYSIETLSIAYTILTNLRGKAIINGDIIGQIGKSSLHRNLPLSWATTSYFMCKLHNYSRYAGNELKKWIYSARHSKTMSIYDLFSLEIRQGRWAAQENIIYNIIGVPYLNIFNCRDIISLWTRTARKERQKALLHKEILRRLNGQMLSVPFGADNNILFRIARSNALLFYMAVYIKYFAGGLRGWNSAQNR